MSNRCGYSGGAGKGGGMGRGMGRGSGGGRGKGEGKGQGRCGGQGMGKGTGKGRREIPRFDSAPNSESYDDAQNAQALRALEKEMTAQLRAVNKQIADFKGAGRFPAVEQSEHSAAEEVDFNKMTAVVDKEQCISCGFCVEICPAEAITMNDTVVIDADKCTACGSCINECPHEAISMSRVTKSAAS